MSMLKYNTMKYASSICVVDNAADVNAETVATLRQHGYRAYSLSSGEECLAQLETGRSPDLILLDIDLGQENMDGSETASRIYEKYGLPVVFFTGHTESKAFAKTRDIPNYGYVQKTQGSTPFLLATLDLALKHYKTEQEYRRSERHFRHIFEYTPAALWEEDITALNAELQRLREEGITDLRSYLDTHPEEIDRLAALVEVLDVNEVAVNMLGAKSKQEVRKSLSYYILPETRKILRREFLALWEGRVEVQEQSKNRTLDGRILDVLVMISNPPKDLGGERLLVTTVDITERLRLERELQESNTQLEKALQEKEYLLREIHHRVKNNLNVVASMISLKSPRSAEDHHLRDIHNQITAIITLHEMLYQSEEMTSVDLGSYLENLLRSIFDSLSEVPVHLESDVREVRVNPNLAIPLALAANEIATNAIKHGFSPEEPAVFRLSIKHSDEGDFLEITLANSGRPFPKGIDFSTTDTMGLQLIDSLVRQVEGTISLERGEETQFLITLPLPAET